MIVGEGRYDDGPDDAPTPDPAVIQSMLRAFTNSGAPAGYGLDVGVMDDRRTDMVKVNDGWGSLWLYKGTYSPREYLQPVETRWMEMVAHG